MADEFCCFWCHENDQLKLFWHAGPGTIVCKRCRVNPVLTKWQKKCPNIHGLTPSSDWAAKVEREWWEAL